MTNAGDALLQAILDEPDADDVRLIYADWLDEHGAAWQREHAALIRWQIATGAVLEFRADGSGCKWRYLTRRKGKAPKAAWGALGWLCPSMMWANRLVKFERGFISEIECPCKAWMECGPEVAQRHPLTRVGLVDKRQEDRGNDDFFICRDEPGPQHLPRPLFEALKGSGEGFDAEEPWGVILGRWLSRACIAWARAVKCLRCNDTGAVDPGQIGELRSCLDCEAGRKRLADLGEDYIGRLGMEMATGRERRILDVIRKGLP